MEMQVALVVVLVGALEVESDFEAIAGAVEV